MARVFISYRRADGQYAVGWIQERLKSLADERKIEVAFFDENLRIGDDLDQVLAERVAACEILVAVIGPAWAGESDGEQPARILDEDDWVGRELAMALEANKKIFPVLIHGADPLEPDNLAPRHAPLTTKLAVHFDDQAGLDQLEASIRDYLRCEDHKRACAEGLNDPLDRPPLRPNPIHATAILLTAAAAGVLGWVLAVEEGAGSFRTSAVTVETAAAGAVGAFGLWYLITILSKQLELDGRWTRLEGRWRELFATLAVVIAVILWAATQYGRIDGTSTPTTLIAVLALTLATPTAVIALAAIYSTGPKRPDGGYVTTGQRIDSVVERARAGITAATLLTVVATAGTVSAAAKLHDEAACEVTELVSWGALLSVIIFGVLAFGRSRLTPENVQLGDHLEQYATDHVADRVDLLFTEPVPQGRRLMLIPILAPLAAGLILGLTCPAF